MTKRYDARDLRKVLAAAHRYYGGKMTRDCDCKVSGEDEETKKEETDLFVFDSKKAKDRHPPRTLAQMNQFLRDYYPRRRTTAAR